ncbi:MAG: hypothetical protein RO469_10550 [Thermincola sp.]|jgi:hypothetical protein|nr:hypothetical protein [Thermincola sp.]MDT3701980.1 hypothetical protein [Thermincola sp.]
MSEAFINGKKEMIMELVKNQRVVGEKLLKDSQPQNTVDFPSAEYESWVSTTGKILTRNFSDDSLSQSFLKNLETDISTGLHDPVKTDNEINEDTAKIILRRILHNFYKHIQAMYQQQMHGSAKIKQEDLNKIVIGNEYDVQHILFALLRPIFPETRTEVTEDAGYKAVRYDIWLDEYNIAIEIKCSRENMKERDLTEELGADAFHYKASHLFMFIFDKEKIISNIDAFVKSLKRGKDTFGKDVEAIVAQTITF